jgi:hypothetical protein
MATVLLSSSWGKKNWKELRGRRGSSNIRYILDRKCNERH